MTDKLNLPALREAVEVYAVCATHGTTICADAFPADSTYWCLGCRFNAVRAALPALLDEVEALRAENAALKNENAQLRGEFDGQCSHGIPEDDDCAECETAYAKYLARSAKAQP